MNKIRRMYNVELLNNDLFYTKNCTQEENEKYKSMPQDELPDDIIVDPNYPSYHLQYIKGELTDEEIKIYLLAKLNSHVRVIKGCVIFFVVLAVLGIILGFIGIYK